MFILSIAIVASESGHKGNINKGVAVLLMLLSVVLSCGAPGWQYRDSIEEKFIPKYEQTSPFYKMPKKGKGDIEFHADFQLSMADDKYVITMFYSYDQNDLVYLLARNELSKAFFTIHSRKYSFSDGNTSVYSCDRF